MIKCKTHFAGLAVAAVLLVVPAFSGYAQDATAPAAPAASPAAPASAPAEPPPASVPRPSIVPKATEPASPQADAGTEPAPRHPRRYAHRHYRHYAYWQPFPVYWPHLWHNRIVWNRMPWFSF
jgi:hypothetical protein